MYLNSVVTSSLVRELHYQSDSHNQKSKIHRFMVAIRSFHLTSSTQSPAFNPVTSAGDSSSTRLTYCDIERRNKKGKVSFDLKI